MRNLADPHERPATGPLGQIVVAGVVAAGLLLVSTESFLLFHSLSELFSIIIGSALFLIAWNTRRIVSNDFLLFLGVGYLAVSAVDGLHLLAFPGMNVIGSGRGLSSQLWLVSRAIEAATLLLAPFFLRRRVSPLGTGVAFAAAAAALLLLIRFDLFPATVAGGELTTFKSASEVVIALLLVASMANLWRHRELVDPSAFRLILASVGVRVVSELSFVVYTDPYGIANLLGHLLKVSATFLLYKALIENVLMRPYALLFRSMKEHEAQLNAAAGELEAFSYAVSHDLRTPLTTVSGFAELLLHEPEKGLTEEQRDYASQIVQAAKRMANIIDDLLRLGQLSRGSVELTSVDVSALCRDVVADLRRAEPARHVDVNIEPGLVARGDQRLLRSAFENLVGNAWKFTARAEDARITIGLRRDPDAGPELYVQDNGAGFDPARADRMFAPFARLHSQKDFSGTGVGLATVRRIVQRHGGAVRAEGEVGNGATFYVKLPELRIRKENA